MLENVKVPVHGVGSLLRKYGRMLKIPALVVLDLLSLCFLAYAVLGGFWCRAIPQSVDASGTMDRIDMYMTNEISGALDGVLAVEKHYWLSDSELVAPEPVQTNYGTAQSAAELQWLLDEAGQILDMETAQKFVDDNNIRFSVAFGPILVDNGQRCEPYDYELGEVNMHFPRAALCQRGALHYVIVVSNREAEYYTTPTIHTFAARVAELGCEKAYTLDGGQTAVIAMNDQLINAVHFGSQRQISDIIYFATALPGGG